MTQYYLDELLGEEEERLVGEELAAAIEEDGDELTIDQYLAEEDVLRESVALYRSMQTYLDTYTPGICQKLTWDEFAELVARTSVIARPPPLPPALSAAKIPKPIPQARAIPAWRGEMVTLSPAATTRGTTPSRANSPRCSRSAANPTTTAPSSS